MLSDRDCNVSDRDCNVSDRDCNVGDRDCNVSDRDCNVGDRDYNVGDRDCNVGDRDCNVSDRDCNHYVGNRVIELSMTLRPLAYFPASSFDCLQYAQLTGDREGLGCMSTTTIP